MSKAGTPSLTADPNAVFRNSALYREFLLEREEILRHKWYLSEQAGQDVGFEKALLDWIVKHRAAWRCQRENALAKEKTGG
ncbi:MAG: DUF4032 domain-containing protein [Verrucomicrobia bacterium]|nr:DUF4032 domain-containing protein [Verrucomicrobiota bacterium]NBR63637.1 DUF4032 domain-containing protein [Verrucomicrobiota bacterium]